MISVGVSQDLIRKLNVLLQPKKEVGDKVEDKVEEHNDTDEEHNDTDEEMEAYKPNEISFLTLIDDEYNQTIVKKTPTIYGTGVCPCGG